MASSSATIKRMSTASQRLRVVVSFGLLCTAGVFVSAAAAPVASAQSSTQKFTLTAVNFTGLSQYAPEQAERAAGLENGSSITLDDLANAAARLGKSGAFDSVNYRYTTRGTNLTADITVTESKHVLRCRFDNFVWFSNDELEQALKSKVPLYAGNTLPESGDSVQQAKGALQDLLHAKGLPGEVTFLPYALPNGTLDSFLFRIDGTAMPIKAVTFTGESKVTEKQLAVAAAGLLDQNYSAVDVEDYAKTGLLPLYHQRGYLRAAFEPAKAELIAPEAKGPSFDVVVTYAVNEGDQYSLSSINWSGNQAISATELGKAFGMAPHEVGNTLKIDSGLHAAAKIYGSQGYIEARVQPTVSFDENAKLVAYTVAVSEGVQYKMGNVSFNGAPQQVASILAKQWKLKPGAVYDANYLPQFISTVAMPELLRNGLKNVQLLPQFHTDPATQKVDLDFKLAAPPQASAPPQK
jgi:outer membrane protein insertion porin family